MFKQSIKRFGYINLFIIGVLVTILSLILVLIANLVFIPLLLVSQGSPSGTALLGMILFLLSIFIGGLAAAVVVLWMMKRKKSFI